MAFMILKNFFINWHELKINEFQIMKYKSKIVTKSLFYFYMNFEIY